MTRLQLCQKVQRILRIDEGLIGQTPTATTGQTGKLLEIVSFVDDAYQTIQSEQDEWAFRVNQGTITLSSGTRVYSRSTIQGELSTYDKWLALNGADRGPYVLHYRNSEGVGDSQPTYYVPYERWRGYFDRGTRSTGRPSHFTEHPDMSLEFDPTPNATIKVVLDFRRTLHTLTADGTEPLIPPEFQDAIVWTAVRNYCLSRDGRTELFQKAELERKREMSRLRVSQLPDLTWRTDLYYGSSFR